MFALDDLAATSEKKKNPTNLGHERCFFALKESFTFAFIRKVRTNSPRPDFKPVCLASRQVLFLRCRAEMATVVLATSGSLRALGLRVGEGCTSGCCARMRRILARCSVAVIAAGSLLS